MIEIHLIWAQDENGGIGKDGKLPWHISEDLKNFKRLTSGSTILMHIHPMISCHKRIQHYHEIPWIATLRSQ